MKRTRECVILAGGLGTRLRPAVGDVPKPMAIVNGKPFLYYILRWLINYDTGRIIISAGYKSQSIISYFGDAYEGIPILYAVEEKPLGTGGAVKYAASMTVAPDILVINGDTYFPIDIDRLWKAHTDNRFLFTIALKRMKNFSRYGSVNLAGNTITGFNEKNYCTDGLINGGIYLINRDFIQSLAMQETFSLEKDVLMKRVNEEVFHGLVFDDTFVDIGIPEDYNRAKMLLKNIDF